MDKLKRHGPALFGLAIFFVLILLAYLFPDRPRPPPPEPSAKARWA